MYYSKLAKNIHVIVPLITSIATSTYTIYMLTLSNASVITGNLARLLLYTPTIVSSIMLNILSPYTIGLLGLILVTVFICKGRMSKAVIVLTLVYLYSVLFLVDTLNTIPLYVSSLIILLVSYGWIRGIYYTPTRISSGKVRFIVSLIAEYILVYIIALAFSTWYTRLLFYIIHTLPGRMPYPLSLIYSMIIETRVGVLLATIVVFLVLLWLINQITETLLLKYTLTRDTALLIVRRELSLLRSKVLTVESHGILDYTTTFLILLPVYPFILMEVGRVVDSPLNHVLSLIVYLVIARVVKDWIKSVVQGTLSFKTLLALSIITLIIVFTLYTINGYNPIVLVKSIIEGRGIAYDLFKEYILEFERRVIAIEDYVKHFEEVVKLIIHVMWG